jgi:hypothetical protein
VRPHAARRRSPARRIRAETAATSGTSQIRYCGESTFAKATIPTSVAVTASTNVAALSRARPYSHAATTIAATTASDERSATAEGRAPASWAYARFGV